MGLSCGERISMIRSAVLIQYTRVTDRRTDGRTDRIGVAYTRYSILLLSLVITENVILLRSFRKSWHSVQRRYQNFIRKLGCFRFCACARNIWPEMNENLSNRRNLNTKEMSVIENDGWQISADFRPKAEITLFGARANKGFRSAIAKVLTITLGSLRPNPNPNLSPIPIPNPMFATADLYDGGPPPNKNIAVGR